jgi:hypothetical protein
MANENSLTTMLVNLQKMRAGIDSAIAGLTVALAASGAMVPNNDGSDPMPFMAQGSIGHQPTELPRGAFLNKSLPAAVKLYLSAVMKKQSIKEIATALRDGGVESTSENFEGVITGCLNRMKTNGEILRFDDGWALAEFYPARLRSSLSSAQEGAPKRVPAKKSASKKKGKNSPHPAKKAGKPAPGEGLDERVEAFTRSHQGDWITFKDVMSGLPDLSRQAAATSLGRIAKDKGWSRNEAGQYQVGD